MSGLVDALTRPGNLLLLIFIVGALLLTFGHRRSGSSLVGFAAMFAVAIMLLPIDGWVSAPLENRFPPPQLPEHVDGIILLGGAIRMKMTEVHGQVALNRMGERMTETLALARRYPDVPVLVSGGSASAFPQPGRLTEAAAMRNLLVEDGVNPGRIVMEDRSRNTCENALFSKEVANPRAGQIWLLVTSANAVPRAVGCFRHVGWDVLPIPVEYHSGGRGMNIDFDFAGELDGLRDPVHEWIGLVAYRLLGRIDSFFPGPRRSASLTALVAAPHEPIGD